MGINTENYMEKNTVLQYKEHLTRFNHFFISPGKKEKVNSF